MKSMIALIALLITSNVFAAQPSDSEIKCNYVIATSLLENKAGANNSMVLPAEVRGDIVLKKEGSSYKAELQIDPKTLRIYFDATMDDSNGLALSIKVVEERFAGPKVLVSTTSIHNADSAGSLRGSQIVRSPDIENIALKNNIAFGDAALNESLPTGLSFVGAMISCN